MTATPTPATPTPRGATSAAKARVPVSVYTTASHAVERHDGDTATQSPGSPAHAKVMGTTVTLCGRSTLSWVKFINLPFSAAVGERCRECVLAFVEMTGDRY